MQIKLFEQLTIIKERRKRNQNCNFVTVEIHTEEITGLKYEDENVKDPPELFQEDP